MTKPPELADYYSISDVIANSPDLLPTESVEVYGTTYSMPLTTGAGDGDPRVIVPSFPCLSR